ncbi:MAG: hypothetical protein ACK544_04920 [Microcystis sp.]|jgi:hypothetical protein|nr:MULTISPECIES: hypothetical protein [unclassified Microcystis]
MQPVQLFQQVKLGKDVPNAVFQKGDQGTIVEFCLLMNNNQKQVIS